MGFDAVKKFYYGDRDMKKEGAEAVRRTEASKTYEEPAIGLTLSYQDQGSEGFGVALLGLDKIQSGGTALTGLGVSGHFDAAHAEEANARYEKAVGILKNSNGCIFYKDSCLAI